MRIAVFGATGSTGRSLVAQALDEGHSVVACARHPEKLGIAHDRLTVVEGDLSDVAAIERAVERADGVISLLGQGMPQKGTPIAHGTRNILAAMKKLGVRRVVVVATASAADPPGRRRAHADAAVRRARLALPAGGLFLSARRGPRQGPRRGLGAPLRK